MGRPGPPAAATGTTRLVATGQIKRSAAVVIDDALWRRRVAAGRLVRRRI
jgi:hypothetical protein